MSACPFSDPKMLWEDLCAARAEPGLVWSEIMGRWVVSRYDDITRALHNPATFSSAPVVPDSPPAIRAILAGRVPERGTLIGHDNPTHDRLRAAVNTFFMPRRIARYESWIEAQAHALIDGFYEEGEVDLRERLSSPLPLKAISHIVGLDPNRSAEYRRALETFTRLSSDDIQPLLDYHAHIEEIMAERRLERREDLISHVWNLRDSGEAVMSDFEMLSLFPGLMLAGHETSSNLLVMALTHLLNRPGAYEQAQRDDDSRAQALEECFRFEGPITGMPRVVTRPVTLAGQALQPGEQVFLAYASGNRDEVYFPEGERLESGRAYARQHIAFGQGIHACLGAPLARLILKVELRVIAERLPNLRSAIPYDERRYLPLREVRALVATPFAWEVLDSHRAMRGAHQTPSVVAADDGWIRATLAARRHVSKSVVELTIAGVSGSLPDWAPGAHVEVELPNGLVRQYSLCGEKTGSGDWVVAVRREAEGRGGSRYVCDALKVGDRLRLKPPRNHFELKPANGPVLLVAGGIGITPLLSMAETLALRGVDWRLIFLGREVKDMAYTARLLALDPARVLVWPSAERGRFDLKAELAAAASDATVYCCGPERLMTAVEGLGDAFGLKVQLERFIPRQIDRTDDRPFEVVIASTGRSLTVAADETLLQALNRAGYTLLSTCQQGTCGSCEVGVADGQVIHRDTVLTREEHAAGETMMACVSRCAGDRLILRL